jgi:Short C-terminal domain
MRRRRGGLVRGVARTAVVAGTASAVAGRVHHHQNEKWSEQEQAQYDAQQPQVVYAEAPPAAAPADDDMAEIQKLAQLHTQGILTDEEFAAKKKQILGI